MLSSEGEGGKNHWKMIPAERQSVKTANGKQMLIEGVANVNLTVCKRNVRNEIHITPDLSGLIIRNDWIVEQERLVWDYTHNQVRFGDSNEWIAFRREIDMGGRRVVLQTITVLLPRQET